MNDKLIVKQLQNCADMFEDVLLIAQKGDKTAESASINAITFRALNILYDVISSLKEKEPE